MGHVCTVFTGKSTLVSLECREVYSQSMSAVSLPAHNEVIYTEYKSLLPTTSSRSPLRWESGFFFLFSTFSPLKKRLCKTAAAPAAEGEQCPKAARAGGCERPVTIDKVQTCL